MSSPDTVLIIGAGPAGLAAAHAASGLGWRVLIMAPKQMTPQRGPLLLQRPLPGITVSHPDGYIKQVVKGGNILDYRQKLYGDVNININGDILEKGYHAWELQTAYDKLWDLYSNYIYDTTVTVDDMRVLNEDGYYHLIINTAPANAFCDQEGHAFRSVPVTITLEAQPEVVDNTIVFNAEPSEPWVRSSRIFGHESTEWPAGIMPPGGFRIYKPMGTNCSCWPKVLRTGRFGAWKNEVWVDTAYYQTREALL